MTRAGLRFAMVEWRHALAGAAVGCAAGVFLPWQGTAAVVAIGLAMIVWAEISLRRIERDLRELRCVTIADVERGLWLVGGDHEPAEDWQKRVLAKIDEEGRARAEETP